MDHLHRAIEASRDELRRQLNLIGLSGVQADKIMQAACDHETRVRAAIATQARMGIMEHFEEFPPDAETLERLRKRGL
jgi:hypothetical protein